MLLEGAKTALREQGGLRLQPHRRNRTRSSPTRRGLLYASKTHFTAPPQAGATRYIATVRIALMQFSECMVYAALLSRMGFRRLPSTDGEAGVSLDAGSALNQSSRSFT